MSWPWIIGMLKTPWLGIRSLSFKIYIEKNIFYKVLYIKVNLSERYKIIIIVNNIIKRLRIIDLIASRAEIALRNYKYYY